MTDPDARPRNDDTVVLSVNLSKGRVTQHMLSYRVKSRNAHAITEEIDKMVSKILEAECKLPRDE